MSRDAAWLLAIVLGLIAIGVVMLYSATAVTAEQSPRHEDGFFFLKRQLLWASLGLAGLIIVSRVPYGKWARWRWPILAVTAVLLVFVFVPGVGAQINGARRWVRAGGFFFQPSEAARIGLMIFLCAFAARDPERLKRFFGGFVPAFAVLCCVAGLIIVEPDVGTALFITMVMTLTLFVAGIRLRHLLPVGLVLGLAMAYFVVTHMEHVLDRLQTYRDPESDPLGKGLQIRQSLMALGSGGWTGTGLGEGTSKLYFLPEAHSDFIFPIIGEELGFLGAGAVVLLYIGLGLMGYRIMMKAPDRFGFLLSFSITSYIILQAAINVAVVTAAVPTKGIPLPFVSAGGSSLLCTMVGVGLLVSVAEATERGKCREAGFASSSQEGERAVTSSPVSPSPGMP